MKMIKSLAVLLGLTVSATAGAVQWGEDTTNPEFTSGLSTSGSIYCSTTACNTSGLSLTGPVITMRAYQTQTNTGTQGGNPVENGTGNTWVSAQIRTYLMGSHVGIGITSADDAAAGTTGAESMIDNNGVDDILVIDFGSTGWDVSSLSVGRTCNASGATATACNTGNADISAWLTDTLPTAFTGNGSAANPNVAYSALTFSSGDPGGVGQRVISGSNKGQYLIITGNPNQYVDAFTIKGITADKVTTPSGQAPIPGSLPLVGLALLALYWTARRRAVVIRR